MNEKRPVEPRISIQESLEVLGELERAAPAGQTSNNRKMRVPYTSRKIIIEFEESAGRKLRFTVQGRNLSKRGMAVLHAQYVHTGKTCVSFLPTLDGTSMVSISGTVRRCRLVRGRTHEIAIAFDRDIDLADFIKLDGVQRRTYVAEAAQDHPGEATAKPATALGGKVLVIDDFDASRDLYSLWLKKGGYSPLVAVDTREAKPLLANHRVDVALLTLNFGDAASAIAAVQELRAAVGAGPIIGITNEETGVLSAAPRDVGCDDVLCKPFGADDLLLSIRAALSGDPYCPANRAPIHSSMRTDDDVLPALQKFADQARTLADMLRTTLENEQRSETLRICRRLADTGASFGFAAVADVSRQAIDALQKDTGKQSMRREVDRVIGVLNRIEI